MKRIVMFYGRECPYSQAVMPMIDKLKEEGIAIIDKREVWHDEQNEALREDYADILERDCERKTIVPSFVDPMEKRALCNPKDYVELNTWILKKEKGSD